jgi:hypothetical protein
MKKDWAEERVLFRFNAVDVKVRPSFWPMWLSSWPALIWLAKRRRPERSWKESFVVGTVAMPLPLAADLGHALAHTVSAKAAGAPMDEIRLAADMPRTIYFDNDVTPDQHRLRAIGGTIYSFICLLFSLFWRALTKPGSANRELAEISCFGQGMIFFGSLLPVATVDGGTLLKWTLVVQGETEEEADRKVKRATMGAGIGLAVAVAMVAMRFMVKRKQE